MERFLLIIHKAGSFLKKQSKWLSQYSKALKPSLSISSQWHHYAPHLAALLDQRNNINAAALSPAFCGDSENILWKEIEVLNGESGVSNSDIEWSSVFQDNIFNDSTILQISEEELSSVAQAVHNLCDQLPPCGTFLLDVVIESDFLSGLDTCKNMDITGALYRLVIWHKAVVTILANSDGNDTFLKSWKNVLCANVSSKDAHFHSSSIWRGSMQIAGTRAEDLFSMTGLQLTVDDESENVWFTLKEMLGIEKYKSKHDNQKLPIVVSSYIEVLEDCSTATIPSFLICPIQLKLSVYSDSKSLNKAQKFLSFANRKHGVSTILRIKYSFSEKSDIDCVLPTTDEWKKAVYSGNVKSIIPLTMDGAKQVTFAIMSDGKSTSLSACLFPMRDPSDIKVGFYNSIITSPAVSLSDLEQARNQARSLIESLPHCPENAWKQVKSIIQEVQKKVLKEWMEHSHSVKDQESRTQNITELYLILATVENAVLSRLGMNNLTQPTILKDCQIPELLCEVERDPSDWPERIALLNKELQSVKLRKYSSDALGGLSPPRPSNNTIIIGAKDFAKYFNRNGEAKMTTVKTKHTSVIIPLKRCFSHKPRSTFKEAVAATWPDVADIFYHDIYYNVNEKCEEMEVTSNKIKERLISQETASTCNIHQEASQYTTVVLPKDEPLEDKPVNVNLTKLKRSESFHQPLRRSPRKHLNSTLNLHRNNNNREIAHQRSKTTEPKNKSDRERQPLIALRRSPRKHPQSIINKNLDLGPPLRRSPRKHKSSLQYACSYINSYNPREVGKFKNIKSSLSFDDELSEKHKMKLREAVASSLEVHGITLQHPSFKACGRKLFAVCKTFVKDVVGKGNTTAQMKKIAEAHAKQVVDFEMQKSQ